MDTYTLPVVVVSNKGLPGHHRRIVKNTRIATCPGQADRSGYSRRIARAELGF